MDFHVHVTPDEWQHKERLGLQLPAGAHRILRLLAADDASTMTEMLSAGILALSRMDRTSRRAGIAEVRQLTNGELD